MQVRAQRIGGLVQAKMYAFGLSLPSRGEESESK